MSYYLNWGIDPPPTSPAAHVLSDINALSEAIQEFRRFRMHPAGILLAAALNSLRELHSDTVLGMLVDSETTAVHEARSKGILHVISLLQQDGFGLDEIIQERIEGLRNNAISPPTS